MVITPEPRLSLPVPIPAIAQCGNRRGQVSGEPRTSLLVSPPSACPSRSRTALTYREGTRPSLAHLRGESASFVWVLDVYRSANIPSTFMCILILITHKGRCFLLLKNWGSEIFKAPPLKCSVRAIFFSIYIWTFLSILTQIPRNQNIARNQRLREGYIVKEQDT